MKSILTILVLSAFCLNSFSTVHTVQVSSNQFTPSNLNVAVGDQVRFVYVSGVHTSTCDPNSLPGTSFPPGAMGWDNSMTSSNDNFTIDITVEGNYIYGCQPHWPGMSGSITATGAIPVVMSEFKVSEVNKSARLAWKTENELNSDYFSVRRSVDGTNFTEIGKVPAAGNSSVPKSYSFTDVNLTKKDKFIYYNIATYDKDGKKAFSSTLVFKNPLATGGVIHSLSPNPVKKPGHLMIKFNADKRGKLDAKLINSEGKILLETTMEAFPGLNNGHFHLGGIASGTYSVLFKLNGVEETYKIVVE